MIAASAIYDGAFRSDLLETTDAERSLWTMRHRPTDMPHPQYAESDSRSGQNGGCNQLWGTLITDLLGVWPFCYTNENRRQRAQMYKSFRFVHRQRRYSRNGSAGSNVRFGSKADIGTDQRNVRFTPQSRHPRATQKERDRHNGPSPQSHYLSMPPSRIRSECRASSIFASGSLSPPSSGC